jgi:hypothetical protein
MIILVGEDVQMAKKTSNNNMSLMQMDIMEAFGAYEIEMFRKSDFFHIGYEFVLIVNYM